MAPNRKYPLLRIIPWRWVSRRSHHRVAVEQLAGLGLSLRLLEPDNTDGDSSPATAPGVA